MLNRLIKEVMFFSFSRDEREKIMPKILDVNLKYIRIWAVVELLYWAYCMLMTLREADFLLCRDIYLAAFIVCLIVAGVTCFFTVKQRRVILASALILQLAILFPGVFIARYMAPKTIVIFASALIVPVMFITTTLSTILVLLANVILLIMVGTPGMEPETFKWTLTNLIIFSSIGTVIGHFVNKDRFERYMIAEKAVQLAESNARLAELQRRNAYYDQMTGLQNRRAYSEKLDQLALDLPADCCIIMADINGLKKTNDTIGHEGGDELIVGTAECLRQSFPGVDSIYRIGGDEFCVVLNSDAEGATECLRRLEEVSRAWKGKYIDGISVSYGFAQAKEFPDLDSMLRAADERMYTFKNNYYLTIGEGCSRR